MGLATPHQSAAMLLLLRRARRVRPPGQGRRGDGHVRERQTAGWGLTGRAGSVSLEGRAGKVSRGVGAAGQKCQPRAGASGEGASEGGSGVSASGAGPREARPREAGPRCQPPARGRRGGASGGGPEVSASGAGPREAGLKCQPSGWVRGPGRRARSVSPRSPTQSVGRGGGARSVSRAV